jgi:hypothetical protein
MNLVGEDSVLGKGKDVGNRTNTSKKAILEYVEWTEPPPIPEGPTEVPTQGSCARCECQHGQKLLFPTVKSEKMQGQGQIQCRQRQIYARKQR